MSTNTFLRRLIIPALWMSACRLSLLHVCMYAHLASSFLPGYNCSYAITCFDTFLGDGGGGGIIGDSLAISRQSNCRQLSHFAICRQSKCRQSINQLSTFLPPPFYWCICQRHKLCKGWLGKGSLHKGFLRGDLSCGKISDQVDCRSLKNILGNSFLSDWEVGH